MTSNQHCFRVPQCSLWKCQTSSFHLREILSDLLSPLFLSWGACLYRAMFHLNIKACEEVARHFKWHFLGFSQGMWLLKCPRWRDLITETMQALWRQGDRNLYLSTLSSAAETNTEVHLHPQGAAFFFRLHTLNGIREIVHIFACETKEPWWRTCFWHVLLSQLAVHYAVPSAGRTHYRQSLERLALKLPRVVFCSTNKSYVYIIAKKSILEVEKHAGCIRFPVKHLQGRFFDVLLACCFITRHIPAEPANNVPKREAILKANLLAGKWKFCSILNGTGLH